MEPLTTLNRWSERLRDRERMGTFARFLARRFLDDRLFQAAGSLAYTTVFALVPLAMVVFGVLSAFPTFEGWSKALQDYIFTNFVPNAASEVQAKLDALVKNTGTLTVTGVIGVIISLLITLNSVEATFNRIWRVAGARPKVSRFLVYWTVLTLGALLAAASIALSASFYGLSFFSTEEGKLLERFSLALAPMLIEFFAISAIYRVVPHRTVKWRYAAAGALLATLLLELIKWGLGVYLTTFESYQKLYGALAALPILLLWIYLCWISVLLGASLASSISAFRYQPASMRLPQGFELYGLLRVLGRFREARKEGLGMHLDQMQQMEPSLTDSLIQQFVGQLEAANMLRRAEDGEWLLTRDLDDLTLAELYEACQLRVPIGEAQLPGRDDAVGAAAFKALNDLRLPLRDLLKPRIDDLLEVKNEQ